MRLRACVSVGSRQTTAPASVTAAAVAAAAGTTAGLVEQGSAALQGTNLLLPSVCTPQHIFPLRFLYPFLCLTYFFSLSCFSTIPSFPLPLIF